MMIPEVSPSTALEAGPSLVVCERVPDQQNADIEVDAVGVHAEPEASWDEMPELDPTKSVQPEVPQTRIDEMEL